MARHRGIFRRPRASSKSPRGRLAPYHRPLRIEPLEDRLLLATFSVTNLDDFGAGSLRQAIVDANNMGGADRVDLTGVSGTLAVALGELEITDALTITGPGADRLTLDAQQNSRIFNINTTAGNFSITGLTLTGGRTTGDGINISDTTYRGGAIRSLTTGTLTITRSTVSGNSTEGDFARGGGIFAVGNLTIIQSTVSGNSTAGENANGGGIRANGDITLTQSTVSGNSTAGYLARGGGISTSSGTLTITRSIISGNSTTGNSGHGGGFYANQTVTITQSTVSGNSTAGSSSPGGGFFAGNLTITESTVSGNSTSGSNARGGGIATNGDVTLNHSTVTDNHAHEGAAVGGGISNDDDPIDITNSIVAGNTAGGGMPDISPGTGTFNVNYSLIGVDPGGIVGANNITGIDPLLGPLAFNGGPTQTHALLALSPAINAGDPSIGFDAGEFDQRGAPFTRVVDGGGGLRIDMGAFERQNLSGTLVVDITADEDDGDYSVGDLSLREAIVLANGTDVDTVAFDPIVFGTPQVIALTLGEIEIGEAVTIDGPGQALLTVDAQQNSRIFNIVAATGDFTIADLTLTGGRTAGVGINSPLNTIRGGAIRSLTSGTLTIERSNISGNSTAGDFAFGGGISASGAVMLNQSTISGNSTSGHLSRGGGIRTPAAVTLNQSIVSGNSTSGTNADGGGISAGSVTLNQSTVDGNSTAGDDAGGGGIFGSGQVTLNQSTVSGNSTAGDNADGGGIYSSSVGDVTLNQSIVSGNSTAGSNSGGGGIFLSFGIVTLTESTVIGNSTTGSNSDGGGIFGGGTVTLTGSTVVGNSTAGNSSIGGGFFAGGSATLTDSTVSGNSTAGSDSLGGGIFAFGPVTLNQSTVSGNSTAGFNADGGGIRTTNSSAHVTLNQSTVSGNSTAGQSSYGGGISAQGDVTLSRSTVTDNHATHVTSVGGGIKNDDDTVNITHSIVAGNTASGAAPDLAPGTGTLDVDFSLIGDTSGLTAGQLAAINAGALNQLNVDPLLAPLANNGGPTQTHALLAGSPAIDAGNPFVFFDPNEFDQRGAPFVRVADGGVAGVRIDIGAYERQAATLPALIVDTAVDESDGDYSGGDFSLREALGLANGSIGANVITFAPTLEGETIALLLGELGIVDSVSINGLGANRLTIDAQQNSRIFNINDGDNANPLDVAISGLTLTGGNADDDGGAIRSFERLELTRSVVSGSSVSGIGNTGGGIYLRMFGGMTSTISDSLIVGNSSEQSGGGIRTLTAAGDLLEIVNSTISGNSANSIGGGLRIAGGGNTTIAHSTIAFNMADADMNGLGSGGGMTVESGARVTLDHTIVADNVDPTSAAPDVSGSIEAYFSLLGDTTGVTISAGANNLLDVKPQLGPLADNGGPTRTHALAAGSPAIDAGDPAAMAGMGDVPLFDQRGNPFRRVFDGDGAGGHRIDIGAFEAQPLPPAFCGDYNQNGIVDAADYTVWRNTLGQTGVTPYSGADGNGDGNITQADYEVWKSNYGKVLPPPGAGSGAVSNAALEQPPALMQSLALVQAGVREVAPAGAGADGTQDDHSSMPPSFIVAGDLPDLRSSRYAAAPFRASSRVGSVRSESLSPRAVDLLLAVTERTSPHEPSDAEFWLHDRDDVDEAHDEIALLALDAALTERDADF